MHDKCDICRVCVLLEFLECACLFIITAVDDATATIRLLTTTIVWRMGSNSVSFIFNQFVNRRERTRLLRRGCQLAILICTYFSVVCVCCSNYYCIVSIACVSENKREKTILVYYIYTHISPPSSISDLNVVRKKNWSQDYDVRQYFFERHDKLLWSEMLDNECICIRCCWYMGVKNIIINENNCICFISEYLFFNESNIKIWRFIGNAWSFGFYFYWLILSMVSLDNWIMISKQPKKGVDHAKIILRGIAINIYFKRK